MKPKVIVDINNVFISNALCRISRQSSIRCEAIQATGRGITALREHMEAVMLFITDDQGTATQATEESPQTQAVYTELDCHAKHWYPPDIEVFRLADETPQLVHYIRHKIDDCLVVNA